MDMGRKWRTNSGFFGVGRNRHAEEDEAKVAAGDEKGGSPLYTADSSSGGDRAKLLRPCFGRSKRR